MDNPHIKIPVNPSPGGAQGIEEGPTGDDYSAAVGTDAGTLRQIEQQRHLTQN